MKVDLNIFEMSYLLEACLTGSHLRTGTIDKFVDSWYNILTEQQRYNLYEWALRLVYNGSFKPSDRCCGADVKFMKRYDPENQYEVTCSFKGKKSKERAFLCEDKYYINSKEYITPVYILKVKKIVPNVERTEEEMKATNRN